MLKHKAQGIEPAGFAKKTDPAGPIKTRPARPGESPEKARQREQWARLQTEAETKLTDALRVLPGEAVINLAHDLRAEPQRDGDVASWVSRELLRRAWLPGLETVLTGGKR